MSFLFRSIGFAAAAALLLFAWACDSGPGDNEPDNPFDPDNPATGGDPFRVTASHDDGEVELSWTDPGFSGVGGIVVFRRTEFDSLFARVDTTGPDVTSWTDERAAYFARSWYRITAYGLTGTEADTAGRAPDSVDVPPLLEIAGGAATTAHREVELRIAAERAEEMKISDDSLFAGAEWEAFDTALTWTLPADSGAKTLFLLVRREGETLSDTVSASIEPAETAGKLTLAGGDSLVARREVAVEVRASLPTRITLSEDSLFGDTGDSVFLYDGTENLQPLELTWTFDDEPVTKTLLAEIANEFAAETLAASVDPDLLEEATAVFSWEDSVTGECEVPVDLSANAVLMRLASTQNDLLAAPWGAFASDTVWTAGPSEGTYEVWVQLENDFATRWLSDSILFAPTPLSLVITEPADSAEFGAGDTLSLAGEVVNASCREAPDSITVALPDTTFSAANGSSGWTALWAITEAPAETTLTAIAVSCTDDADTTAVDTVYILLLPDAD